MRLDDLQSENGWLDNEKPSQNKRAVRGERKKKRKKKKRRNPEGSFDAWREK